MSDTDRAEIIIQELYDAVVAFDNEAAVRIAMAAVEEGVDAYDAVTKGLGGAMEHVGHLYDTQQYFVPQLLLCADTLYEALAILKPHIKLEALDSLIRGKIVIGVIEGDIHDIGKNLVSTMFATSGWSVSDLGKDVKLRLFVDEMTSSDADIVCVSALMTTSMLGMPKLIGMLREERADALVMIGGAPVNEHVADMFKASAYARNAAAAVEAAAELLSARQTTAVSS